MKVSVYNLVELKADESLNKLSSPRLFVFFVCTSDTMWKVLEVPFLPVVNYLFQNFSAGSHSRQALILHCKASQEQKARFLSLRGMRNGFSSPTSIVTEHGDNHLCFRSRC